ncbi:metal-dependent hydrolase [Acinetobacter gyllenbergii]|uniref:metal-dependent hydrolase n=1 Tax=Acinetobacter gyllenbergii TaxID=134534 RepID=UPI000806D077|nr:metal-dependent hydrolase [Acinetobacter gyllenbergii]OBY72754.1 metal-dependent hydrolase [Acinetobacter gyllenbergii]
MTLKTSGISTANRKKASFPVRRLSFDFPQTNRYWFDNDSYLTHMMNAMSGIFPQGELMLIEALRKIRGEIDNELLQAEISAFIGQEAMHAKEHIAFNNYASEQGIDIATLEAEMKWIYQWMQKLLPSMHIMAVGCAVEHTTATLGAAILRDDSWSRLLNGPVGELWLWHSLEENEHKAVFFDAYVAAGGGYVLRAFYMAVAGSILTLLIFNNMRRLLIGDKVLSLKGIVKFCSRIGGAKGLVNQKSLGDFADYFRRDFHPFDHDTKALEQLWRQRLGLTTV